MKARWEKICRIRVWMLKKIKLKRLEVCRDTDHVPSWKLLNTYIHT